MDNGSQVAKPLVATPQRLEQRYSEIFSPQPGAVRPGERFEVFTLTDYSVQVRVTDSTGPINQ